MDLRGKSIVITGASRGLGAALAHALGRQGARLLLVARGQDELAGVAAAIRAEGGTAHSFPADVSAPAAAPAIAAAAAELVGPVDLVVHNASALGPTPLEPLSDTDPEALAQVLETNLLGPFRLTRALLGQMVLRGGGLCLFITSDAAQVPYPRWGAYGLSKAALEHLGRIWAAELEGSGVRFLSIDPGEMRTRMHADAVPDADPATLLNPADVARQIVALLGQSDALPSGARVLAAAGATGS